MNDDALAALRQQRLRRCCNLTAVERHQDRTVGTGALVAVLIWAAQKLAGPPAGMATAALLLATSAAIWWLSLDRSAGMFLAHREKLIETLAKVEDV